MLGIRLLQIVQRPAAVVHSGVNNGQLERPDTTLFALVFDIPQESLGIRELSRTGLEVSERRQSSIRKSV